MGWSGLQRGRVSALHNQVQSEGAVAEVLLKLSVLNNHITGVVRFSFIYKPSNKRESRGGEKKKKHTHIEIVYKLQQRVEKSLLDFLEAQPKGASERSSRDVSLYHKSLSCRCRKRSSYRPAPETFLRSEVLDTTRQLRSTVGAPRSSRHIQDSFLSHKDYPNRGGRGRANPPPPPKNPSAFRVFAESISSTVLLLSLMKE